MAFGSVANQAVKTGKTRELVLASIKILGESPVLIVEHLGETNPAFWSDAIAKANAEGHRVGKRRRASRLDAAQLVAARAKNRETMIRHSVRGTKGFFHDRDDAPGVADPKRPAGADDIAAIVNALPPHVFDDALEFVLDPGNFVDDEIQGDPKALAGE